MRLPKILVLTDLPGKGLEVAGVRAVSAVGEARRPDGAGRGEARVAGTVGRKHAAESAPNVARVRGVHAM